jgi:hypothetical protein
VADNNNLKGAEEASPLQLLIDAVVDYAIYMIGPQGRVMSWNSGAQRLIFETKTSDT